MTTWQIVLLCVCGFVGAAAGGFVTTYYTAADLRRWIKKLLGGKR